MACLQNIFFFRVQTKTVETDFVVAFLVPVPVSAAKRRVGFNYSLFQCTRKVNKECKIDMIIFYNSETNPVTR